MHREVLDKTLHLMHFAMMKKLTMKQKMQHLRRAPKGYRRGGRTLHRVSMWYRNAAWRAKVPNTLELRSFPKVMCFKRTPEETLQAFEYVRKTLHRLKNNKLWFKPNLKPQKEVTIGGYIAMDEVREISTSAALVLAAEYERKAINMDERAPLFGIEKWDAGLLHKLEQIGFLRGFGYKRPAVGDEAAYSDVLTVPFYSGTKTEMEVVDQQLLKLVEHIDPGFQIDSNMVIALNSAVGEAATNTREHAYKEYHTFKYPHVGRWWATGAASISERRIVVSLYDQGVTIPVSYPRLPAFQRMMASLNLFSSPTESPYVNDAKLIQAATVYGNTGRDIDSAGVNKRVGGFGLPQIKDAINLCGGGCLMILSRGGRYIYTVDQNGKSEQLDTFDFSVGGTLIEWTVTLPEPV